MGREKRQGGRELILKERNPEKRIMGFNITNGVGRRNGTNNYEEALASLLNNRTSSPPPAFPRRLEALGRGYGAHSLPPGDVPPAPRGSHVMWVDRPFPGRATASSSASAQASAFSGRQHHSDPSKAPLLRYETPSPFARLILIRRWGLDLHHFPVCLTKKIHR